MPIVFEEIRDLAKKRIAEKTKVVVKNLTEREMQEITFFIGDMERYIKQYANEGKQKFVYDCSKLEKHVFHALAEKFKEVNKYFFVTTRDGCQELTVEWTGKNEV